MTITTQFNFNINYNIKILQETDPIYKDVENIYNVSKINDDISEVSIENNGASSRFIEGTNFSVMTEPLTSLFEKNIYIKKDIVISSKTEEVNSGLTPQVPDITKYKYVVRDELNSYVFRNENPFPDISIYVVDLLDYIGQEYTPDNLGTEYFNRSIIAQRLIPTYSTNTENLTVTYQFPHGGHSKGDSFYYLLDSTNTLQALPSEFTVDYLEGIVEYQGDIGSLDGVNIVGIYNIEKVWVDGLGDIEINSTTKTKYQTGFNTFKNITYNNDVIKVDKISNTSYVLYFYKDCIIQPIEPNTITIDGLILNRYNSYDNSEITEYNIIPAKTEILVNQVSILETSTDGYNDAGQFIGTVVSSFDNRNDSISSLYNDYLNTLVQDAYAYNATNGLIITPLDQLEKGNSSFSFLFNDGDLPPTGCTPSVFVFTNVGVGNGNPGGQNLLSYSLNGGEVQTFVGPTNTTMFNVLREFFQQTGIGTVYDGDNGGGPFVMPDNNSNTIYGVSSSQEDLPLAVLGRNIIDVLPTPTTLQFFRQPSDPNSDICNLLGLENGFTLHACGILEQVAGV